MSIFNINTPLNNTIIMYIIFVLVLLVVKPNIIYCHKTQKFKAFGCHENETFVPFPIMCISGAIMIYMVLSTLDNL